MNVSVDDWKNYRKEKEELRTNVIARAKDYPDEDGTFPSLPLQSPRRNQPSLVSSMVSRWEMRATAGAAAIAKCAVKVGAEQREVGNASATYVWTNMSDGPSAGDFTLSMAWERWLFVTEN